MYSNIFKAFEKQMKPLFNKIAEKTSLKKQMQCAIKKLVVSKEYLKSHV